jgi:hypothetical protein
MSRTIPLTDFIPAQLSAEIETVVIETTVSLWANTNPE